MRIIAGDMRGRPLSAPSGSTTRPTTDRVRESLMSSIFSIRGTFDDAVVLDAFAGSGALGLEAISRGARFAVFCDSDAKAQAVLVKNLSIALKESTRLARIDVFKQLPPAAQQPFDLLFFDPPYATDAVDVAGLLTRLDEAGMVAPRAIVSYEHDKSADCAVESAFGALPWTLVKRKAYGSTTIDLLRKD